MITHIVSGYPRSGTSMVMEALQAGGLQVAHTNFRLIPEERYEIPQQVQADPNFPKQYWGRAIKILFPNAGWVLKMCPQDNPETNRYFVICMRRSFVEVSQSYARAVKDKDGKPLKWEIKDEATHDAQFAAAVEILECRNDCDVVVWDYGEVIADPLRHFNTVPGLQQPRAAAKIPDKNKRTFLGGFTFSIVSEQAVGNS